jgi:hypothetical protein
MTSQGLQPQAPADLRAQLVALVAATSPDYTANLPGSLVEDIASTDTYALVLSDSFLVDLVNSLTPYGANAFLLNQLGVLYGVDPQPVTNTSINVVFTGPPGYVITQGFVVSDGTYQYVCQEGGTCGTNGQTLLIYAIATVAGAWPVPPNTVVQLVTSVPAGVTIAVTNPIDGLPSTAGELIAEYRERCWTAGLAASTGMSRYLKTLLGNIPGVQTRLISVQAFEESYIIIVGGGDPYQVAYAIWEAEFFVPGLVGATIDIANVANSNPIVVTTANNHNLTTGDVETISGIVGFPFLNDRSYPVTVTGAKTFSIPVDGTPWGAYQYGGTVKPNPINQLVTLTDYPDTYAIPFVVPAQETVHMTVTWITDSPNYVSADAIAQAATPALVDYIDGIAAGPTPINLNVMTQLFLEAIAQILTGEAVVDLAFSISVGGVGVLPNPGTQVIYGDPYSYFYTDATMVQVLQGT